MNVLIMDVEGTDGRERGEDQDFERKSALFSMASAEVLMVNMWENQVGLYQGANMGLLKTVFEVNLGLFQSGKEKSGPSKDKTLLLFVIRDHVGITPLENLRGTIMADLGKIWDGLNKVSFFRESNFYSLPFDLIVPLLPFSDPIFHLHLQLLLYFLHFSKARKPSISSHLRFLRFLLHSFTSQTSKASRFHQTSRFT